MGICSNPVNRKRKDAAETKDNNIINLTIYNKFKRGKDTNKCQLGILIENQPGNRGGSLMMFAVVSKHFIVIP
jgi:hypothetical protein